MAGCINGRTTVLEDEYATARSVVVAARQTGTPALVVTGATDLELLPQEVALSKVRLLGRVGDAVKEGLL
jgi:hypothetical protein